MTSRLSIIRLTNPYYINGCEYFRYVHKIEIRFTITMKFLALTLLCLSAVSALSFLRKLPNSKPGTYFSYQTLKSDNFVKFRSKNSGGTSRQPWTVSMASSNIQIHSRWKIFLRRNSLQRTVDSNSRPVCHRVNISFVFRVISLIC
jgi:hypothetical protein